MLNKEKPVQLNIDKEKCSNCGLCVSVCSEYLTMTDETVTVRNDSLFGCIQCGHCMMICPNNAIEIVGEAIDKDHIRSLSENIPDYDSVYSLLLKRRSIRKFKKQEVSKDIIDKILEAASTSAIGIPPSEVKVIVINGTDKVQEFADEIAKSMKKFLKIMNPVTLSIFRPIIGKTNYKLFNDFVVPLCSFILEGRKEGKDNLFYNAPAIIIFTGSEFTDKEDQIIAATTATIAAESLGLGTCIIGTVPPFLLQNKYLKEKYGILKGQKIGQAFILGYPELKFNKGIKRNFKDVKYFS